MCCVHSPRLLQWYTQHYCCNDLHEYYCLVHSLPPSLPPCAICWTACSISDTGGVVFVMQQTTTRGDLQAVCVPLLNPCTMHMLHGSVCSSTYVCALTISMCTGSETSCPPRPQQCSSVCEFSYDAHPTPSLCRVYLLVCLRSLYWILQMS